MRNQQGVAAVLVSLSICAVCVTGCGKKEEAAAPSPKASPIAEGNKISVTKTTPSSGATVTANRLWKCPKCGTVLVKGGLGKYWNPGDPISRVAGTATCGGCMSRYDQADVYGGKYDIEEKAAQQEQKDFEGTVAVITYQLSCTTPPGNAQEICQDLLKRNYAKATLGKFYCIGRTDSQLTAEEGLVQYKEYVKEGKLPDLGTQFDSFTGQDISGKQVVVLFFRE